MDNIEEEIEEMYPIKYNIDQFKKKFTDFNGFAFHATTSYDLEDKIFGEFGSDGIDPIIAEDRAIDIINENDDLKDYFSNWNRKEEINDVTKSIIEAHDGIYFWNNFKSAIKYAYGQRQDVVNEDPSLEPIVIVFDFVNNKDLKTLYDESIVKIDPIYHYRDEKLNKLNWNNPLALYSNIIVNRKIVINEPSCFCNVKRNACDLNDKKCVENEENWTCRCID